MHLERSLDQSERGLVRSGSHSVRNFGVSNKQWPQCSVMEICLKNLEKITSG